MPPTTAKPQGGLRRGPPEVTVTEKNTCLQCIAAVADVPTSGLGFRYTSGPFTEGGILVLTEAGIRAGATMQTPRGPLDHDDPGRFVTSDRRHLVCGKHGALYRPEDGTCVVGPCLGARLRALPIVFDGESAYLDLESLPDPLAGFQHNP